MPALRIDRALACFVLVVSMIVAAAPCAAAGEPFRITVVDDETGRGVPLVELKTVHHCSYWTDSAGVAAFDEPGLMDQRVFFHVRSHGYEYPRDGFGSRGKALDVTPGGRATLKIRRINLAERLYRVTGGGIYRDSVLLGDRPPTAQPVLNAQVLGSDSVLNALYRGTLYWFWGDTNWPRYPLGNFHTPGATSRLPGQGGIDPAEGVNLSYFTAESGFAKETARMAGDGPTWLDAVTVLGDGDREQMFAAFAKIKPPLSVYRRGLCRWNDDRDEFEEIARFPEDAPVRPGGHPFRHTENETDYVYFATPYPLVRVAATPDDFTNLATYEAYTCLKPGSRLDDPQIDRTADGRIRYGWKRDTPAVAAAEQAKLVKAGTLQPHEALLQLRDRDSGKLVTAHGGSVYWNEYRKRWVMIVVEIFGTSVVGEVWYAEAETPLGPWVYAVKVVSHETYSFYNPKQHPLFDQDGGRLIYFEGTYTHTFSGNDTPTPRYDYNQIMYRLDLSRPEVVLPVPVADVSEGRHLRFAAGRTPARFDDWEAIAFFAPDRPGKGTVPVFAEHEADGRTRLRVGANAEEQADATVAPLFHALPADASSRPAAVVPLFEFVHNETGARAYSIQKDWSRLGFVRQDDPVCYVWPNPWKPAAE